MAAAAAAKQEKIMTEFKAITAKTHTQQAKIWLNGFWATGAKDYAETLWNLVALAQEVETGQKKLYGKRKVEVQEGCDLDEQKSHVLLEKLGETLTVQALRKRLKDLDIDLNKRMSISEYLLCKYKKTPADLVNAPQGGEELQAQIQDARSQVQKAEAAIEAAQQAVEASQQAETELKAAEESLRAAVAEVNAQEEAYRSKMASLEAVAGDPAAGAVKKNKAANELAQMKAEDPLPLRRAKITQEAALKRAEKSRKTAEIEKAKATEAAKAAEANLASAQDTLDALTKRGGDAMGDLWWMDREMKEMRKYMPGKQ